MKKNFFNLLFISLLIILFPLSTSAENFKPAVIGILDIQRIKKESKAIISIREQITIERDKYEKNFRSKEEILRKEEQEIAKQRTVLSAEAFKKKNNEFRKKVQSLQEKMQKASQLLQKAEAEAIREFNNNLRPVLIESSNAYSVNVVLFASQVAFAPRSLDLTSDVMKRLDIAIPNIKVKFQDSAN